MKNKHGSSVVRSSRDKSGNLTESEGRWPAMRMTCLIAAWAEALCTVRNAMRRIEVSGVVDSHLRDEMQL